MVNILRYASCVFLGLILGLSVTLYSKEHTSLHDQSFSYPLLKDVIDTVQVYYVNQVSQEELIQAAIEGIFSHLDPYSSFLNQQDMLNLRESNKGEYFGFGFEIATEQDKITIVTPFTGSPAEQAGLHPGDQIVKFNNAPITEINLTTVLNDIKNHSINNLPIALTINRTNDNSTFDVNLSPSRVSIKSVSGTLLNDNIGYIRLENFQEDTSKKLLKQLYQWQQQPMQGLILDLRNNPGGLLEQAIQIADMFLERGRIVSTEGRFFDANSDYFASPHSIFHHIPIMVLINKGSASASEVLAAALQENNRATLFGETSFGKGTIQSLIPILLDGNAVKLTVAKYSTPKGQDIHKKGIEPDIKFVHEAVAHIDNMPIIDSISPHDDIAEDKVINRAIAWMKVNR